MEGWGRSRIGIVFEMVVVVARGRCCLGSVCLLHGGAVVFAIRYRLAWMVLRLRWYYV